MSTRTEPPRWRPAGRVPSLSACCSWSSLTRCRQGSYLGPLQVRFYGIAYASAFVLGIAVASRHLARRGRGPNVTGNIAFWAIVFGLIGARLYFVV